MVTNIDIFLLALCDVGSKSWGKFLSQVRSKNEKRECRSIRNTEHAHWERVGGASVDVLCMYIYERGDKKQGRLRDRQTMLDTCHTCT